MSEIPSKQACTNGRSYPLIDKRDLTQHENAAEACPRRVLDSTPNQFEDDSPITRETVFEKRVLFKFLRLTVLSRVNKFSGFPEKLGERLLPNVQHPLFEARDSHGNVLGYSVSHTIVVNCVGVHQEVAVFKKLKYKTTLLKGP